MVTRTKSTCDKQNNQIASLQKQAAAQQTIINNQKGQLLRAKADAENAYGLLEDERNKQYAGQKVIANQRNTIELLERQQHALVAQIENMTTAHDKITATLSGAALIGGIIVGVLIGQYWDALWQLG